MTTDQVPGPPPTPGWDPASPPGAAEPRPPLHRRPLFWVAVGGGLLALLLVGALVTAAVVGGLVVARSADAMPAPAAAQPAPGGPSPADPGPAPPAPGGEDEDVFALAVGDCLTEAVPESEVDEVPVAPCDAPHASEAFLEHRIEAEELPDDAAMDVLVDEVCLAGFADYVGLPYEESELYVSSLRPTSESWAGGDRELLCLVDAPDGETLTGSVRGSAR